MSEAFPGLFRRVSKPKIGSRKIYSRQWPARLLQNVFQKPVIKVGLSLPSIQTRPDNGLSYKLDCFYLVQICEIRTGLSYIHSVVHRPYLSCILYDLQLMFNSDLSCRLPNIFALSNGHQCSQPSCYHPKKQRSQQKPNSQKHIIDDCST